MTTHPLPKVEPATSTATTAATTATATAVAVAAAAAAVADDETTKKTKEKRAVDTYTVDDAVVVDPLEDLSESERLALAIRFGRVKMCAALTHGHSFETSIFRLPAKCSGCHELVWGPFTRGCTCLTCKLTAHRSCTGMATMPHCPTKGLFAEFCRSEVGFPKRLAPFHEEDHTSDNNNSNNKRCCGSSPQTSPGQPDRAGGDLDEWATVEGSTEELFLKGAGQERQTPALPPPSAAQGIRDLGSSFSWSPFGTTDRKRPVPDDGDNNNHAQEQRQQQPPPSASATALPAQGKESLSRDTLVASSDEGSRPSESPVSPSTATAPYRMRDVGKMTVAGGFVGAVLGGPVGAVVGLKLGAVFGAGRWSAQGLWQRIEKDRKEAGADGAGVLLGDSTAAQKAALGRHPRDVWARIAEQVESEEEPVIWTLDPDQQKLLEQGECDAGEVAMFVVGKVLADETAMPCRLYGALLSEFRSRRRVRDCRRPMRRRSSDTDMVALFPRSGGSRRTVESGGGGGGGGAGYGSGGDASNRLDSTAHDDGAGFFASTPGLEKTFSFVEETEIVEGEGSDNESGEDEYTGFVDSICDRGDWTTNSDGGQTSRGVRSGPVVSSSPVSPEVVVQSAAARRAAAAAASKELRRGRSTRMGSWVELDRSGCSGCGGRVASGMPHGQSTGSSTKDMEEEDGEFGESWATAEAPSCWCMDEGGLSASPEACHSIPHCPHQESPSGSSESVLVNGTEGGREMPEDHVISEQGTAGHGRGDVALASTKVLAPAKVQAEPTAQLPQHTTTVDEKGGKSENGTGTGVPVELSKNDGDDKDVCDALRDVHGVLRELTRAILAWCPLLTVSDEAAIQAVNCIDQRVFAETYGPVYDQIASGQAGERDATLTRRIRKEEHARMSTGRPSLTAVCFPQALAALRAASAARTGRDKLGFFVQAVERISEALPAKATTDALLWSLCRHLAAAMITAGVAIRRVERSGRVDLPRPHAEVAFVEQFVRDESWLMGKQGYVLTTVDAALHVLLDPVMSEEVFLDPLTPE